MRLASRRPAQALATLVGKLLRSRRLDQPTSVVHLVLFGSIPISIPMLHGTALFKYRRAIMQTFHQDPAAPHRLL